MSFVFFFFVFPFCGCARARRMQSAIPVKTRERVSRFVICHIN